MYRPRWSDIGDPLAGRVRLQARRPLFVVRRAVHGHQRSLVELLRLVLRDAPGVHGPLAPLRLTGRLGRRGEQGRLSGRLLARLRLRVVAVPLEDLLLETLVLLAQLVQVQAVLELLVLRAEPGDLGRRRFVGAVEDFVHLHVVERRDAVAGLLEVVERPQAGIRVGRDDRATLREGDPRDVAGEELHRRLDLEARHYWTFTFRKTPAALVFFNTMASGPISSSVSLTAAGSCQLGRKTDTSGTPARLAPCRPSLPNDTASRAVSPAPEAPTRMIGAEPSMRSPMSTRVQPR